MHEPAFGAIVGAAAEHAERGAGRRVGEVAEDGAVEREIAAVVFENRARLRLRDPGAEFNLAEPGRLAALKTTPLPRLKAQWRDLFGSEPPGYNRRFLESRLAYRIQELAYGGLKPETIKRLEALGEQFADRNITRRRIRHDAMPIAGTRLVREWQGLEHTVTVLTDGYEWQGRPYRSLSAIARAITGTRWNGLVFFGLKSRRGAA